MLLSPRREVGEFRKRHKWMALAAVGVFAILAGRMVQLQLLEGERWFAIAEDNITRSYSLPATRGIIRDTRGRVIANNRPSYDVYITPHYLPEEDQQHLADLLGLDEAARENLRQRVEGVPERRQLHSIEMFHDITRDQLAALSTHQLDFRGVDVVRRPVRTYPHGTLGAHAVGYLNEVSAEDLRREGPDSGYRAGDTIGRMGIERAWEGYLRGQRGHRQILVNARGRRQTERLNLARQHETHEPPTPGHDLVLSLDMGLMHTIQRAFGGHPAGSVVVVDVNTGRIRALFSKPSYDLNDFAAGMSHSQYRELQENPFRPLIDKTIYESYFPGSTFKPISALAALADGILEPSGRVECIGYYAIGRQRMGCTSAHGDVDMRSSLVQSCNVYFYKLAEAVGLERLNRYARQFGLGARTGVGINSEARGFLATREWYAEHFGRFRVGYTLNTAIGQGNTRTTLLQLALAYGALANGGTLYSPQLVESIREPDGTVIEEFAPQVRRRLGISDEQMAYVQSGMDGVVNEQNGTAYDARIPGGVRIAGKTGTAEITTGGPRPNVDPRRAWYFTRSHAWFAGYAPVEDPEVAIVVLVEHGGAGGRAAAPIATQVLQEYLGGGADEDEGGR